MRTDRRGVALMLVLWLVVVLGTTAAAVVALSRSDANTVVAYRSRTVARAAAESGLEETLVRLRRAFRSIPSETEASIALERVRQGLRDAGPRPLGGGRYQVAIEDLTGRIPINDADYATLLRLFTLTAGEDRAEALAGAVLDWKDPGDVPGPNGAEAAEYAAAGSPYRPLNRPFQRVEEVGRLLGVDDSLGAVLERLVTVHRAGQLNANTAEPVALAAATGLPLADAERLVRRRAATPFTDLEQVRSALGVESGYVPVSVVPETLLLVSRGWADGRPYTREIRAVVEIRGWGDPDWEVVVVDREARDL